ncbi:MAG: D-2-hydroxyacid dehydrogenase [bacterium]|nr:D-2-hydroxyacid dehydrogenase [bacterium]
MRKLLIISNDIEQAGVERNPHTFRPEHLEKLKAAAAGSEVEVVVASPNDAPAHYASAEIVASFPARMPDIALLPQAKWLHSFSAGVDRILTPQVAASDIVLSNSRGVHATPIAEHIIAFMLVFTRGMQQTFHNQQKHLWQKAHSLGELRDQVVLIVGMGEIGTEAARLAHAFGARVFAISRSQKEKRDFVEKTGLQKDLDVLLPEADFVVITLPHTQETHHLFDTKKFALMKRSAVIINIGRGGIVNEIDLIDALNKKVIAGAGLDVTEQEPLHQDSPLWDMEQVVITPHHSGLSHKYMDRAIDLLCKNLTAYLAGDPSTELRARKLPTEVDKTLGY